MAVYDKYPGYIINQRQENSGSLNSYNFNLTGTVINSVGTSTEAGLFQKLEIPFLFFQPNMPSFKSLCKPYKLVGSHVGKGDDNRYNSVGEGSCPGTSDIFVSDEYCFPTSTKTREFFTIPSGRGNFYLTDVYFWTTGLNPLQAPASIQFGIGSGSDTAVNNICDEQTFIDPSYGSSYVGTIFRVKFEDVGVQPASRGPMAEGTVLKIKNGGPYTFYCTPDDPPINSLGIPTVKFRIILKGYFL